jgi:hypothetical protein
MPPHSDVYSLTIPTFLIPHVYADMFFYSWSVTQDQLQEEMPSRTQEDLPNLINVDMITKKVICLDQESQNFAMPKHKLFLQRF